MTLELTKSEMKHYLNGMCLESDLQIVQTSKSALLLLFFNRIRTNLENT